MKNEKVVVTQEVMIEQQALATYGIVADLRVVDAESYRRACQLELNIKADVKEAASYFEPIKKKAHEAWQETIRQHKRAIAKWLEALELLTDRRVKWEIEQEEKRRQAETEKQQKAAETAKAEAQQVAKILVESGEEELAKSVLENVVVPTIVEKSEVPKIKGISTAVSWDFRIKNEAKINRQFLTPNESAIRKVVTSLGKGAEKAVGGIEVFEKHVPRSRVW